MEKHLLRAILIDVIDPKTSRSEAENRLEELESLVHTFGGIVVVKTIQKRDLPDYQNYIGQGKLNEIINLAHESDAEVLILNNILKPRQIFHLNERFRKEKIEMKAWDRVDLILKIFDKHAQSTEAKLQIELASIKHMGPRIFGMGIELSRQAGAMGVRAGAGEANIELMKRHLQGQELSLLKKLEHYEKINEGHRSRRRRNNFKTVALVGYTNAGKSSLLNALTSKGVYVADQLFATLDTRIGKLYIEREQDGQEYKRGHEILISDTIGFIQDLPPSLIKAFKSTLAETVEADLILHVIDVNDRQMTKKIKVAEEILDQLGLHDRPKIYVFNKIDLIAPRTVFEERKTIVREKGPLRAGHETAELLGWIKNAGREDEAVYVMKKLTQKYRDMQPVFCSAADGLNLEQVIKSITQNL
ncbi:GTPase HflX [Candidatus Peregrinibacteria bacterium]|nr:GTPase HflX [Candidatus Peregrinibacteria bacterium]